jgi:hypothetical protein
MRILFAIFLSISSLQAGLHLEVSVFNKKGIDIGLTLASELHAVEEVMQDHPIKLKMKNGVRVELDCSYELDSDVYGPNDKIVVSGNIWDKTGRNLKVIKKGELIIPINEFKTLYHEKESQMIELKIRPIYK